MNYICYFIYQSRDSTTRTKLTRLSVLVLLQGKARCDQSEINSQFSRRGVIPICNSYWQRIYPIWYGIVVTKLRGPQKLPNLCNYQRQCFFTFTKKTIVTKVYWEIYKNIKKCDNYSYSILIYVLYTIKTKSCVLKVPFSQLIIHWFITQADNIWD